MFAYKHYVRLYNLSMINFRRQMSTADAYTSVKIQNGIKTITMCHAKTRNSLSLTMMQTLVDDITKNQDDPTMRVIIITAAGPIFSAGHNLKELSIQHGQEQHQRVFSLASHLMTSIIDSPVPVIARVDGLAAAAGCQLVAQCDLALCSEKSSFSTPGANVGIFCSTPGIALGRTLQKKHALHMLLTGLPISSHEALTSGLVNKVCSAETLDLELEKITSAVIHKSRSVIANGKKFFYRQMQLDIRSAYALGEKVMADSCSTVQGKEGIDSFIEKRKPKWIH